jgi:hypothetical protein
MMGLLGEAAESGEVGTFPAFSPDRLAMTARYFIDLIVLPQLMRALSGEHLKTLHAEIGSHVSQRVAFFLGNAGKAASANRVWLRQKFTVTAPARKFRGLDSAPRQTDRAKLLRSASAEIQWSAPRTLDDHSLCGGQPGLDRQKRAFHNRSFRDSRMSSLRVLCRRASL